MLKKIPLWGIWATFGLVSLIVSLILIFAWVKPTMDNASDTNSSAAGVEQQGGTDTAVMQHKTDLKNAEKSAEAARQNWAVSSARYMPPLPFNSHDTNADLINIYEFRNVYGKAGFKDIPTVWGTWITNWYDAQHKEGVDRAEGTEFPIPAFPSDPNYISTVKYLAFPSDNSPWTVTVNCANFRDAVDHLERFNKMTGHGIPVISHVSLSGHSPNLQMTYTLQVYVLPSPGLKPPPPDSRLSVGTGGGGGAMGMPGGMGMYGAMGPGAMGPPSMMGGGGPRGKAPHAGGGGMGAAK